LVAFVILLACAGILQFRADESWFAFAGEQARLVPKALASALVTGAVLVLLLPASMARRPNT
jgi:hypothetical protein